MTQKLPFHEWIIISLLIAILLSLIAIAYIRHEPALPLTESSHELISSDIQVSIGGAVANSGIYTIKQGSLLEDLLRLAVLLPEAETKSLKLQQKLRDGQRIKVPTKPTITVFIEGAVYCAGPLQVLKGTKVSDLIERLQFEPKADIQKLQKKRPLKDQEVIFVPSKKEKIKRKTAEKSQVDVEEHEQENPSMSKGEKNSD